MNVNRSRLVVLAGKPGTGKTTLARGLASALPAVYVRIDAIETAVIRSGVARPPVGVVGYVVAHEIARSNLLLGATVVVDGVNPVADARRGWRVLAAEVSATLAVFETQLSDHEEHRRRVVSRHPDLEDQFVPTWEQVTAGQYEPWNVDRDGPRTVIETMDADFALATAIAHLDE